MAQEGWLNLFRTIHALVIAFVTLVKGHAEPVRGLFEGHLEVRDAIVMPRRHGLILTDIVSRSCSKAISTATRIQQNSAEVNMGGWLLRMLRMRGSCRELSFRGRQ